MTQGILEWVDGPPPQAPDFTLISTSEIVPDASERWLNGVAVAAYPTDLPQVIDPCATGSAVATKPTGTAPPQPTFGSFAVVLGAMCTGRALGLEQARKAVEQKAGAVFTATEAFAVEQEFETGLRVPANIFLSKAGAAILNGGTVTNLMNGLALLEAAIAATGRKGVIHASPRTVSAWSQSYALQVKNGALRTILGTPVVPGYGYQGTPPAGQAANTGTKEWAYATGPLQIRRSDVIVVPDTGPAGIAAGLDRSVNTMVWRVERYYVLYYGGFLRSAVNIDRCQTAC